ncbi:lysM domain-containing protein [Colletotrichum spaethianum]|uniref:LysM domain-containing protein n=1 Tax=Colletotrichum spaethianum TaxID=700344 RepID=A0AA37PGW7_9PEZI|nr:lysM domain-containing protein [Colletotrichum spaethianum]GKT51997.1 lysM domain-containing protein [Colletotrichum spaethianum]
MPDKGTLKCYLTLNPPSPSVGADCSGIVIGNSYCVEVNFGLPRSATRRPSNTTTTTASSVTTATRNVKPSPTQLGLTADCTHFYFAVADDSFEGILAKFGTFTFADFYCWNPAVAPSCDTLWASTWYCVGCHYDQSHDNDNGPEGSLSNNTGVVAGCRRWHLAGSGDDYASVVGRYDTFPLAQLYD